MTRPVEAFPGLAVPFIAEPVADAVAATLSLLVPGAGQALRRNWSGALLFVSATGFCLAAGWAVLATHAGLTRTLALLGAPAATSTGVLGVLGGVLAILHISSVLSALSHEAPGTRGAAHPALTALASCLIPGWGQILNGSSIRAGILLGVSWLTVLGAVAFSPAGLRLLASAGAGVPAWMNSPWGGAVTLGLPVLAWIVGVYDATATAIMHRRG